eukprot:6058200-Pleurochrysis_carterae.AAC.2
MELPCRVGRREKHSSQISLNHSFHKRDTTPSLFTSTIITDHQCRTNMLDKIRTLIRAREAARSSGGVEHRHTSPRASGSWLSAVPKPSGSDMVDASTQSERYP